MEDTLTGGCECGAVRYTVNPSVRFQPYACHCSDCQTRSGSAFGLQLLVMSADLCIEGETVEGGHTLKRRGGRERCVRALPDPDRRHEQPATGRHDPASRDAGRERLSRARLPPVDIAQAALGGYSRRCPHLGNATRRHGGVAPAASSHCG